MKKLLYTATLLYLCLSSFGATHIYFDVGQFGANPEVNRQVTLQPTTPFVGNVIFLSLTDSSGVTWYSNASVGTYNGVIKAPPGQITFQVSVTSTNLGVINALTNTSVSGVQSVPAGAAAWSITSSDARYARSLSNMNLGTLSGSDGVTIVNGANAVLGGGTAIIITNLPQSSVYGLTNALTFLTNSIGSGVATNAIANNSGSGTNTELRGTTIAERLVATNYIGNGAELTNIITTIYVATNGNNATGVRGNPSLPFRNFYNASLVAHRGDTIKGGPGGYNETNSIVVPDDGYLIFHPDSVVTNWLTGVSSIPGCLVKPSTNSTVVDFFWVDSQFGASGDNIYAAGLGSYANNGQKPFINATIIRPRWFGSSDGLYIQHSNVCTMTVIDPVGYSDWDNVMIKGEPSSSEYVPHQVSIIGGKLTGNHGGGWTNRTTYGIAVHATGAKVFLNGTSIYMTNTTFNGLATAISVGGSVSTETYALIQNSSFWSTTLADTIIAIGLNDNFAELVGCSTPPQLNPVYDGIIIKHPQSITAGTLYGIPLPSVVTNWGGIPFLKWTSGGSNVWALTRTNAGAGSVLHRPSSLSSVNGNPTASAGEPYWAKVWLGGGSITPDVDGDLPTDKIDWATPILTPNAIIGVNAALTDVEESPLTYSGGTVSGSGNGITGDDEAYGAGWNGDITFPTKNAVYDKIETMSGGGGNAWLTNGNSGLPAGSFLGTLDNLTLELRSSNSPLAQFSGYSNIITLGTLNTISGWQPHSSITGGRGNLIDGPTNSNFHFVLGYNHIGGGATNFILGGLLGGNVIGGGVGNVIDDNGANTISIGGGNSNSSSNSALVTIGGGGLNRVGRSDLTANYATIGGGYQNFIPGAGNLNLTNEYATISGGFSNRASGGFAAIPGGNQNQASGSNSFAAGFRARALHPGSFVWSDVSSDTATASRNNNDVVIRATGGMNLDGSFTNSGTIRSTNGFYTGGQQTFNDTDGVKHLNGQLTLDGTTGVRVRFNGGTKFIFDNNEMYPNNNSTYALGKSGNAFGIVTVGSHVLTTNGVVLPQLANIPTNSILPFAAGGATNWTLCNLVNRGPVFVATNTAAAGSFVIRTPTSTDTIVGP